MGERVGEGKGWGRVEVDGESGVGGGWERGNCSRFSGGGKRKICAGGSGCGIICRMSAKKNVALDDSLVAEARRLAGSRTATAAVHKALREYISARNGAGAAKPNGRGAAAPRPKKKAAAKKGRKGKKLSSWDALEALAREMRETGWIERNNEWVRRGGAGKIY